jgi:hypothetical protein
VDRFDHRVGPAERGIDPDPIGRGETRDQIVVTEPERGRGDGGAILAPFDRGGGGALLGSGEIDPLRSTSAAEPPTEIVVAHRGLPSVERVIHLIS